MVEKGLCVPGKGVLTYRNHVSSICPRCRFSSGRRIRRRTRRGSCRGRHRRAGDRLGGVTWTWTENHALWEGETGRGPRRGRARGRRREPRRARARVWGSGGVLRQPSCVCRWTVIDNARDRNLFSADFSRARSILYQLLPRESNQTTAEYRSNGDVERSLGATNAFYELKKFERAPSSVFARASGRDGAEEEVGGGARRGSDCGSKCTGCVCGCRGQPYTL